MFSPGWYTFYGLCFLLVSSVTLPLHILIGYAVFRMSSFRRRIVLPMVFSLSVCDTIQLVAHALSGLLILINGELDLTLNIIIGMTLEGLWCVTLYQHVAIALNRLVIFTKKGVPPESCSYVF
ncbi:hypothetical protein M3Y97_00292000 [Aphelenchoides bicaudatus]|nr:hypothetical protein M3Y97_00292000 [Aphelenchoides bicaudatus]